MAYTFEQIFAADPSNPERVATDGTVTIFMPGDETRTPVAISTADGLTLPNPVQVNEHGFGPAFMHESLDRVAWSGGGFEGFFTSYDGLKQEAVGARLAAENAAASAQAPTDASIDQGIQRADIPGKVVEAVAAAPAVVAAAAAAVNANPKIVELDAQGAKARERLGSIESSVIVYGNGYVRPPVAHVPDAATLGLWSFNNSLNDSSGAGRTLTQYGANAGSYSTIARFGAASLGGGIYQNIGADLGLSSTGADGGTLLNGTVECWVKTIPHTVQKAAVAHRNWYWLGISASGRAMAAYGSPEKQLTGTTVLTGDAITTAPWHHLALVFDNGTVRLFVNGKLEASSATVGTTGAETDGGVTIGGLRLSRTYDWWGGNGRIDEVRISSVPRYAAESSYPSRPPGARPGSALFIGPVIPPERQPFDQWIRTETA